MNPDMPLQLLGGLTARQFLRDYWQKKPLLIRQAIPGFESPLSPDELAGLSLEEEVESRLVIEQGAYPWELRHGPFDDDIYQNLPERQWTLLVQAVDQWVPEVAELIKPFRFLPDWRVDDVMISYAAPGGGVGPHYDNYDVFLLQGCGKRRWRIGDFCDESNPRADHPDLKILAEFPQTDEWVLEPGDILYLPPRIAHDGIAVDECMTYSIGFRAPSVSEVLTHFTDFVAQFTSEDERYTDTDISPVSDPYQIQADTLVRLRTLITEHLSDDRLLMTWFGQFMTEPRYPDQIAGPEQITEADLVAALHQGALLVRNPCARLAWAEIDLGPLLFASGQSRLLSGHLSELTRLLCQAEALYADNLAPWLDDSEAIQLLVELLKQGSLSFSEAEDDEHEYRN